MEKPNYRRMFDLIDAVFATRDDPDQLQVNEKVIEKLNAIHPSTLTELTDENGPLIWSLMIPTTTDVMNDFLNGIISENEIFQKTSPNKNYDCIYLCSVTALPEIRGKGKSKKLCLDAIKSIIKEHEIKTLFVWAFTQEGEKLAESIAKTTELPLLKKPSA